MSKEKFTPGPWGWSMPDEVFPVVFCNETGNIIADLNDPENKQREMVANAKLIAAAPEMYAELKRHCALCMLQHPECEGCEICETRKVLKKARGER